jgi:hypothetical protein
MKKGSKRGRLDGIRRQGERPLGEKGLRVEKVQKIQRNLFEEN